MRHVAFIIAVLLAVVDASAQQPARDPRATTTNKPAAAPVAPSIITGRVTAADSRAPLRQAIVSATNPSAPPREVVTDDRGAFQLLDLQPGAWQLTVKRAGYINGRFGQSRPFGRAAPITLSPGQQVNVEIPLIRASAIVGRIFDEYGEAVTAARVTVLRATVARQRRYLEPVGESDSTDDTGAFRVHSLPAGEYFVTASARTAPPDSGVQTTLAPTFYPGTADFAGAQTVRVEPGSEAVAAFTLLPARNARVSGFVTSSEGRAANAFLSLTPDVELGAAFGAGGLTREDGSFMMAEVPPGTYTLVAEIRSSPTDIAEFATAVVTVNGFDVAGLSLTTRKPGTLRGTIVADAGVRRTLPDGIDVYAHPRRPGIQNTFTTATGTSFELSVPPGPFTLDVGVPNGWALKSVTLGGLDASDLALDIAGEQGVPVTIVLTDRMTDLSGTVAGADAVGASVVVFPADSGNWTGRRVRSARTDARGRFRIVGLPPGNQYLAVAVHGLEDGQETDPEFLKLVQNAGTPFDLSAEEKRILDLKVLQP
jgi:hypothetical protein